MTISTQKRPPAPNRAWAYFLDVDGTLVELAESPAAIHVDQTLLDLVCRVHRAAHGALALVSGRSIADLDARINLRNLPVAGQHGLERRDGHGNLHKHLVSPICSETLMRQLSPLLQRHPGLRLEHKGATVAVHYRQTPRLGGYLKRMLSTFVRQAGGLQLQQGKKVLEIKPSGFDKGSAIREFMESAPFSRRLPVFLGDDLTDEHGFAVVNEMGGITVKVGKGKSRANFRLAGVQAVRDWLARIIDGHDALSEATDEKY